MRRRDKSSRRTECFLSLPPRRECVSLSLSFLPRRKAAVMGAAPPMLCKSSSVCSASLSRPRAGPLHSLVFGLARPSVPFLSVQSSAVVTSFVREEANVIYEQSRRHPSRRPRRRCRRRLRRRARRGLRRIPIAIPSVPIKLLFSAGALGMRR